MLTMTLMIATSGLAVAFHPSRKIADQNVSINLENIIPKSFGQWKAPEQVTAYIVNPLTQENLAKIYSQTLSRTYLNNEGEAVMLSIAYGEDQSDAKSLHYPEVCYPAQGFQVTSNKNGILQTQYGNIRVKRLKTTMGGRVEYITYWSTVGNKVVYSGKETKIEQLRYGFNGEIPDGLLFRVSTISQDEASAFASQEKFVRELISTVPQSSRLRLTGL